MAKVLVTSPHPDDEAIGCGGSICWHVERGDEVDVLFFTSGEGGGHGRGETATVTLREAEARAAAAILGYSPHFWRLSDGALAPAPELVKRFRELLAAEGVNLVYVTNPREMHPDHRASCELVRQAAAGLPAERRPDVLMYEVWTPLERCDEIRDITPFVERKRRAIRAHASQCEQISFDDAILGLNRYRGELLSWPEGDYAEMFERMAF